MTEIGRTYTRHSLKHVLPAILSVRVLTASRNRGKGGAVRLGMFSARGLNLLFADADGATAFKDIERLEKELDARPGSDGSGG